MATKNIVPRADGEGGLGTSSLKWKETHHVTASFGDISLIEDESNTLQLSGGPLVAASGLSGSLQRLSDGSPYLLEGSNITLTTASNGAITIASSLGDVLEDLNTLGAASADGEFIVATGAGAFAYESGATARTSLGLGTGDSPTFTGLTLSGDLTVNGTTTTINTTNLLVEDPVIVLATGSSGPNVNGGIAILSGSATAGQALVFGRVANDTWGVGKKDVTDGTVTDLSTMTLVDFKAAGITASGLTLGSTAVTSTASELNLLDGGTSVGSSITLQSTDGFIVNDNGTMKLIPASDLSTFVGGGGSGGGKHGLTITKIANFTVANFAGSTEERQLYIVNSASPVTATLPDLTTHDGTYDGYEINIKRLGAGIVHITGSSDIDNSHTFDLPSQFSNITLVATGSQYVII